MKKDESEKGNAKEELEEQHVSLVRSERGKGYMCIGNREVYVSSKSKKVVVLRKPRTITIADNIVEQEAMAVELAKFVNINEQRLQQYLRKGSKESKREHVRKEMQAGRGEGSSAAQEDNYEFQEFLESESDATQNSSWSDTNKDDDDDTRDLDMDISENGSDKGDDDVEGFGVFMYKKSQKLPKFTPFSPVVTCSSTKDYKNLINDLSEQELKDLLSTPIYTDTQTT
nr:hypothetical protein [Tanacetum cinerariifolium]